MTTPLALLYMTASRPICRNIFPSSHSRHSIDSSSSILGTNQLDQLFRTPHHGSQDRNCLRRLLHQARVLGLEALSSDTYQIRARREGLKSFVCRVQETLPENVLKLMHAPEKNPNIPLITPAKLEGVSHVDPQTVYGNAHLMMS